MLPQSTSCCKQGQELGLFEKIATQVDYVFGQQLARRTSPLETDGGILEGKEHYVVGGKVCHYFHTCVSLYYLKNKIMVHGNHGQVILDLLASGPPGSLVTLLFSCSFMGDLDALHL